MDPFFWTNEENGETRRRWNFAGQINKSEKKKKEKKKKKIMEKDKGVDGIN